MLIISTQNNMTYILYALIIIGILATIIIFAIRTYRFLEYDSNKPSKKSLFIPLICCCIAIIVSSSFVIIPTNNSGVRTTFGQIDSKILQNGFHWKVPFVQNIETVNNKLQDIKFENKISSETNKRTEIYYNNITVTYHIVPEKSAWIYSNVSDYENNLISEDIVGSAVKSSSKTLDDTDATNRSILEPIVMEYIQKSLNSKYGSGVVAVNKVVVLSANFSNDYNKAIADKQKAQLESEKQTIQNEKNIAKAEADAKVKKTKAQADADAKLISAQAEKKANELKEKSITDKILKEEYISKWNGVMPKFVGDSSSMMFSLNDEK